MINYLSHPLIKNLGWLTAAQALNKIIRLGATIFIARTLMPEDYGLLAIIFTANEMVAVIIGRSTQTQIVNASEQHLDKVCQFAQRFNWQSCIAATLGQIILAGALSVFYELPSLFWPICVLALTHLMLPIAMVNASLTIRRGNLGLVARVDVLQTFIEGVLCIALLITDYGIWSLIIPRILVVPIWIYCHRVSSPWSQKKALCDLDSSGQSVSLLKKNSLYIIATDISVVLKNNIDYLLIGYFLGPEILGLYYFSYNAGLGISSALIHSAGAAMLPHLCKQEANSHSQRQEFWFGLRTIFTMTTAIVALQIFALPYYVPIIFGERWVEFGTLPVIAILCLSALPRVFLEIFGQYLRAKNMLKLDFKINLIFCFVIVAGLFIALPFGLVSIATSIVIASITVVLITVLIIWKKRIFSVSRSVTNYITNG